MEDSAGRQTSANVDNKSSKLEKPNIELQQLLNGLSTGGNIAEFWNTLKSWDKDDIKSAAHDTVPVLYKLLDGDYTEKYAEDVAVIEQVLGLFADACEPKQLLLLVVEEAQQNWTGCKFMVTVPTVSRCISRIAAPQSRAVALSMDAFTAYLEMLPVPNVDNLEGRERMVVDVDPLVRHVCVLFPRFLDFVRPLAKRASSSRDDPVSDHKEVDVLTSSLLRVLDRPLGHLDLTGRRLKRSEPRIIAEECLSILALLHRDFVRLVTDSRNMVEVASGADSAPAEGEKSAVMSGKTTEKRRPNVATFAFLAFGERVVPSRLPHVYSHRFFLEFCAPLLTALFREKDLFPALHGIQFSASLFSRIEPRSLPVDLLESDDLQKLALAIIGQAATARTEELRSSMLRLLSTMCRVLEPAARNRYLYILLKVSPCSGGVVGHVIEMISDEIVANITAVGTNRALERNPFSGVELEHLLQLVFALPSGEKTDLMEHSERIMAALKLLRIVIPLDPKSANRTGIWNVVPLIEQNYLRTLHAAIELSRSHYELEIKRTREERAKRVAGPCSSGDASLSRRQQLGVYEMAVHTLELMESVASQVGGVIEDARKDSAVTSA